jgi:hypothetical protein
MSFNLLTAALSAVIANQRTHNPSTSLAIGAFSGVTPGILSLAIPLVVPVPSAAKGGTSSGGTTAKPPAVFVELDDFVGMDKNDAENEAVAQKMKVTLSPVVVKVAAGVKGPDVDSVVKQHPAAGEWTAVGTHVHLFYAVAAPKAPRVKALTKPEAK